MNDTTAPAASQPLQPLRIDENVRGEDVFVMRLGPDGLPLWTAVFGGSADDEPYGIAISEDGRIIETNRASGIYKVLSRDH